MNHLMRTRLPALIVATIGMVLLAPIRAQDKSPAVPARAETPREPITPKPLSAKIKLGLEYLVKQQDASGGWGQGGGWRIGGGQGRVEGIADPPDVGDTCIAVLALVRSGSTPKQGQYAKEVGRAVKFICKQVEASDERSLYVTDLKGTQMQSKIGPYADTFLATMVLAELKGKMGDDAGNTMLTVSLDKTVRKIEKNQQADGTYAGNNGWASVLSQGFANKALNLACQKGCPVSDETIDRIQKQVKGNFDDKAMTFKPTGDQNSYGNGRGGDNNQKSDPKVGRNFKNPAPTPPMSSVPNDAGVPIYGNSSNLTNVADVVNTLRMRRKQAEDTLESKKASKEEKDKARETLTKLAAAEFLCDQSTRGVVKQLEDPMFVQGFGSNGGEEFLSYLNISEALLLKGGDEWKKWDKAMTESLSRIQDKDGSWSGHHCITGKTFCTATALLVLMADRAPIPIYNPAAVAK